MGMARSAVLSDGSQRAAVICGCIVGFAYSANYTNHAPLAPALMREFGFNQALAGLLTTGIFATHAAMQIPGGHLVDRLGAKRVLLCALAWVALGNLGMAFAGAYWQLLFCKVFTGIGTGVCFVGGARYVHAAAAGARLNLAQGLFGGSVQLGAGFVILAVPRLYLIAGWRAAFIVSAGMALTAALIWQLAAPNVTSGAAPPGRFHEMLLAPQLWVAGAGANGDVRSFRGCRFLGGCDFDESHEGARHSGGAYRVHGAASGNCVQAARRSPSPAYGDSSATGPKSLDDRAGMFRVSFDFDFSG